jgi:methylglutamate dehydrogenase subunit A
VPKDRYDVVIVGGGGHGLATAYYLAKLHGITNVAVLEKGWLGGGNVGRNTTIVRSNYLLPGNEPFYEHSLKLWEGLEQDLNFNVMFSQRGVLNLCHSDAQRDAYTPARQRHADDGRDAELLDARVRSAHGPGLDFDNARFPITGGLLQPRAGTARHDAVAWGYAAGGRPALGVDIIQNCEVTGFASRGRPITGVETTRGRIGAGKVGLAVAGSSLLAEMAGMRLPIESHVLQAFVTEASSPGSTRSSPSAPGISTSASPTRAGWSSAATSTATTPMPSAATCPWSSTSPPAAWRSFPISAAVRLLRSWGGVMDMTMDGSPIIGKLPSTGSISQRRLVLWRLQGDAGLGLVLRPHRPPGLAGRAARAFTNTCYLRDNPAGVHRELWQHELPAAGPGWW